MKKVVRLTESDLVRLVKRVINEQQAQQPVQGRTSQFAWNDISQFIDRTGNAGCSKPFALMANGRVYSKYDPFLLEIVGNKIVYKKQKSGTMVTTGKKLTDNPSNINTCPPEELERSQFGKSKLFQTLKANPGKTFMVTYS